MADILPFKPPIIPYCPSGDFRKAIAAIAVLSGFTDPEKMHMIDVWMARGLVTEDEASALHTFYGWE